VRRALPREIPVSAKLRLGWDNIDDIHRNADAAIEGGAGWLTVHARTKTQGYRPPAYWGPIGEVRRRLRIPVIANGEIWKLDDFRRCRDETGAEHFMLGRGALADPNLPRQVACELGLWKGECAPLAGGRAAWRPLIRRFAELSLPAAPAGGYVARRIKQWVKMAHNRAAIDWFDELKRLETLAEILAFFGENSVETRAGIRADPGRQVEVVHAHHLPPAAQHIQPDLRRS
jgi:tRNA-dihydrouridine synthase C